MNKPSDPHSIQDPQSLLDGDGLGVKHDRAAPGADAASRRRGRSGMASADRAGRAPGNVFNGAAAAGVTIATTPGRAWWLEALTKLPEALANLSGARLSLPSRRRGSKSAGPRVTTLRGTGSSTATVLEGVRELPAWVKILGALAVPLVAAVLLLSREATHATSPRQQTGPAQSANVAPRPHAPVHAHAAPHPHATAHPHAPAPRHTARRGSVHHPRRHSEAASRRSAHAKRADTHRNATAARRRSHDRARPEHHRVTRAVTRQPERTVTTAAAPTSAAPTPTAPTPTAPATTPAAAPTTAVPTASSPTQTSSQPSHPTSPPTKSHRPGEFEFEH